MDQKFHYPTGLWRGGGGVPDPFIVKDYEKGPFFLQPSLMFLYFKMSYNPPLLSPIKAAEWSDGQTQRHNMHLLARNFHSFLDRQRIAKNFWVVDSEANKKVVKYALSVQNYLVGWKWLSVFKNGNFHIFLNKHRCLRMWHQKKWSASEVDFLAFGKLEMPPKWCGCISCHHNL